MKRILLYSGGMDSLIAWEYLERPETLYVDLGHLYADKEIEAVKSTVPDTTILSYPGIGKYEKQDAEIPARNLFLSILAAQEGADIIYMIVQKDEMSIPDRTMPFMEDASAMLSKLFGRFIKIYTPFSDKDKTEMVAWYITNDSSVESIQNLQNTVGCYEGGTRHCGNCPACFRRYVAFMNNGISVDFELTERIKNFYKSRLNKYSKQRQKRMEPWI